MYVCINSTHCVISLQNIHCKIIFVPKLKPITWGNTSNLIDELLTRAKTHVLILSTCTRFPHHLTETSSIFSQIIFQP